MALRVVLDSRARLPVDSQLVRTAKEHPLLVVVTNRADADSVRALQATGAEVVTVAADESGHCANTEWLKELAQRRLTNVLVEGGSSVLGSLWDDGLIDEVHAFVAPKLVGGPGASPITGVGLAAISSHQTLCDVSVQRLDDDLLIHGFVGREHV
jgi:diaminohydroxyphosphoribosylaminopyrimidine deaminase/5-amino-6-(5-phosphoribosylamino)uracil reductase